MRYVGFIYYLVEGVNLKLFREWMLVVDGGVV